MTTQDKSREAFSPTQMDLLRLFFYDPCSGIFKWRTPLSAKHKSGDLAGCVDGRGYACIKIQGHAIRAHRLAWLYVYGERAKILDHINGVKTDNRISNLRLASQQQNQFNVPARKNNKSGFKGVIWKKENRKWVAQATINQKKISLGYFSTPEQASNAYQEFCKRNHGDFHKDITKEIK